MAHLGTIPPRPFGGIGFDLMAAIPAPHDEASTGGSGTA